MAKDNTADAKKNLSSPDAAKKASAAKQKNQDNKPKDGKKDDKPKVNVVKKVVRFFKDLKSEFKKIVWPEKKKIINNTLVVLAFILVVGIGIWLLDALFLYGIFGNLFYFK